MVLALDANRVTSFLIPSVFFSLRSRKSPVVDTMKMIYLVLSVSLLYGSTLTNVPLRLSQWTTVRSTQSLRVLYVTKVSNFPMMVPTVILLSTLRTALTKLTMNVRTVRTATSTILMSLYSNRPAPRSTRTSYMEFLRTMSAIETSARNYLQIVNLEMSSAPVPNVRTSSSCPHKTSVSRTLETELISVLNTILNFSVLLVKKTTGSMVLYAPSSQKST